MRTHRPDQKTTRAIRAVWMLAGDKDRSSFHRIGGLLTQARSRGSTEEHEHCTANMQGQANMIKCGTFAAPSANIFVAGLSPDSDMNNNKIS